jgi:hypothetical protein
MASSSTTTNQDIKDDEVHPDRTVKFSTDAFIGTCGLIPGDTLKKKTTTTKVFHYSYNIHMVMPWSPLNNGTIHPTSVPPPSPPASSSDYYLVDSTGQRYDSMDRMLRKSPRVLRGWHWYDWCIPGQLRIVQTVAAQYMASNTTHFRDIDDVHPVIFTSSSHPPPRGFVWDGIEEYDYRDMFQIHHIPITGTAEISMSLPLFTQSDVLFVPVNVAKEFITAVAMHAASEPKVFLECATPTIVDIVRQVSLTTVRTMCTEP